MICAKPTLTIKNMSGIKNLSDEKNIHLAFEISLLLKGVFALGEIIGGVVAFFVTKEFLLKTVGVLTQEELAEDPQDLIANYLLHSTQNFSISTQYFVALYLLSHGGIKLWLIIGLLRSKTPPTQQNSIQPLTPPIIPFMAINVSIVFDVWRTNRS